MTDMCHYYYYYYCYYYYYYYCPLPPRVFQSRDHAFVHRPTSSDDEEEAEDALIAATGWLEYHTRRHPPNRRPIRHIEAG